MISFRLFNSWLDFKYLAKQRQAVTLSKRKNDAAMVNVLIG